MNLLLLIVALAFVALMPVFVALSIDVVRRRRRQRTPVTVPQLVPGEHVQFQNSPKPPRRENHRRLLNALYFFALSIWAAVLTFHGAPVLGPVAALILLELSLASYRAAGITGGVIFDETTAARVAPILAGLCHSAGCAVPPVTLRDDRVRAAAVRRSKNQTTVVLSRAFVERVGDEELKALLAHEVAHIAHGDLESARRRGLFAVIAGGALAGITALVIDLPGFEGFPIDFAAFILGMLLAVVALSPLNRPKEARADLEGARLAANPRALARALATADAMSQQTRTRLHGRPPWSWLLRPLAWQMPTHPPISDRIARLEAMS